MNQKQNRRLHKTLSSDKKSQTTSSGITFKNRSSSQLLKSTLPIIKHLANPKFSDKKEQIERYYGKSVATNTLPSKLESIKLSGVSRCCVRLMDATFLQSKKKWKQALQMYQIVEKSRNSETKTSIWMIIFNKALCLKALSKYSQSKTAFRQAWEQSNRIFTPALELYIRICLQIGFISELSDLSKSYPEAVSQEFISHGQLVIKFNQALRAKKIGRFQQSLRMFNEIAQSDQGVLNIKARINQGKILQCQNKFQKALQVYKGLQKNVNSNKLDKSIKSIELILAKMGERSKVENKQHVPLKLSESKNQNRSSFSKLKTNTINNESLPPAHLKTSNSMHNRRDSTKSQGLSQISSKNSIQNSSNSSSQNQSEKQYERRRVQSLLARASQNKKTVFGAGRSSRRSSIVNQSAELQRRSTMRESLDKLKDLTAQTSIQFGNCALREQGYHFHHIGKYDLAINALMGSLVGSDKQAQVKILWKLIDCFEKTNEIGQAIRACKNLEQMEGIPAITSKMYQLFEKANRLQRFVNFLKKNVENGLHDSVVYEYLGWACFKIQQNQESLEWLEKAAALNLTSISIKVKLAHVYCKFPKLKVKLDQVLSVIVQKSQDMNSLIKNLKSLVSNKCQSSIVEQNIARLLEKKISLRTKLSKSPFYLFLLARISIFKKQHSVAFDYLNQSLKIDSKCAYSLYELAELHEVVGNHQLAIQTFEKCLELHDSRLQALVKLGNIYQNKQDLVKAQHYYLEAAENCKTGQCFRRIAACANKSGNVKKSLNYYRKSLKYDKSHPDPFENMGDAKFKQGNFQKAEHFYSLAYVKENRQSLIYKRIACLLKLKKYSEALQHLLNNCKPSEQRSKNLGICYYWMGDFTRAIEHFKKCDQLQSTFQSLFNLALSYHKAGQKEIAEQHYISSIGMKPDHSPSVFNLGQLYLSVGNTEKAIHYLQMFEDIKGNDAQCPSPGQIANGQYILIERSY